MTDIHEENAKKPSAKKKKVAPTDMPFEAAMARLEVIVKTLEGDGVALDESLALYEEGVALLRRCNRELDEAEQRVRILQRTPDGEIQPAEFVTTEDGTE